VHPKVTWATVRNNVFSGSYAVFAGIKWHSQPPDAISAWAINASKMYFRSGLNPTLLANSGFSALQGAAEKSGPLNFFAVFSATVWDFNTKFYSFIY